MSHEEFQKKLGEKLRKLRTDKGISLRRFEIMEGGVDRAMVSKIENGQKNPTIKMLRGILLCLDSNLKEFFHNFDEE